MLVIPIFSCPYCFLTYIIWGEGAAEGRTERHRDRDRHRQMYTPPSSTDQETEAERSGILPEVTLW